MSSAYVHGPRGRFGKVPGPRTEPWEQQPGQVTSVAVTTDAMGRTVTSYVTENLEGNGAVRRAETIIEGRGERFEGGIPSPKLNSSNIRAEVMAEQVVNAVANELGMQGGQYGANQKGRAGVGGMFRREQSNYNAAGMRVPQTYNDGGYRGEFDGARGRPGSMYPSGQERLP